MTLLLFVFLFQLLILYKLQIIQTCINSMIIFFYEDTRYTRLLTLLFIINSNHKYSLPLRMLMLSIINNYPSMNKQWLYQEITLFLEYL